MKKIVSLILLLLTGGIFFWYSSYTQGFFDYNIAQFIGYIFYWSVALFIVSLFAFMIDDRKYKIWLLISGIYVIISILIAVGVGDGDSSVVSYDGKSFTWFFAGLYSLVCIIYFIVQFLKNKKQSTLV